MVAAKAITSWPHNAMRHSFCTHHVSAYGSFEKTALLLRDDVGTMRRHYLAHLHPKEESAAYFEILPSKSPAISDGAAN